MRDLPTYSRLPMKKHNRLITTIFVFAAGIAAGIYLSDSAKEDQLSLISNAQAAGGVVKDPDGTAPQRYVYYPGTEELAENEIRLIACGTGLPAARRTGPGTL